jgi:CheY-like chemotaxis protein
VEDATASLVRPAIVLVVDDDSAIREIVSQVLRNEGYDVECAENGAQALEALRGSTPPGLVLLDLIMPVMSGWELLEVVAQHPNLAAIPVVVVSAMTAPGVRDHLSKPIDLDVLLRTVTRFVTPRRS